MTSLKIGKVYITHDDILKHLDLPSDTQLIVADAHDGIEITVIANGSNEHKWLHDATTISSGWSIARNKMELV